jgi:hypothetical protein
MKLLKYLFIVFLALAFILGIVFWLSNERLPEGREIPEAEVLANKLLNAVNADGLKNISRISWKYARNNHSYDWNVKANRVLVMWDDYVVDLNLKDLSGNVLKDKKEIDGDEKKAALQNAWKFFVNDSFWLMAPFKIRDGGTIRKVVTLKDGRDALMVTYSSGGVTPGDSYLWMLDDNGRPTSWKIWASILPLGGMEFTWDNWVEKKGVWFSTTHKGFGPIKIEIEELKVE